MRLRSLLLFVILAPFAAFSQSREPDIRFRLAQSYEQSGDFESASKLYEQVLAKDSTNYLVLEALHRDYIQLKKYDAAIDLVTHLLQRSPNDILWISRLGGLYNLKADDKKANAAWDRAIAVDPSHESTYRAVASSMMESRLFDRAIDIYQRGRVACKNPALFTTDVAYLYSITLNYSAATKEYLSLIRQNPVQLAFTQSRISAYIVRPDGLKAATFAVEDAVKAESGNQPFQQLLAWLYMEAKRYDRAYEIYRGLDATTNAGGHEIFNFAERAFRERGYDVAGIAYRDIITRFPKFDQIAHVKFGSARTLEESSVERDTSNRRVSVSGSRTILSPEPESSPMYAGAIAAYQAVVAEYPKTDFAARSLYRIAVLKQERFFDLDGARLALETLEKNTPSPTVLLDAKLRRGEIYLAMGNLQKAEEILTGMTNQQAIVGDQLERAALRLAELAYYQGKFPEAQSRLEKLTQNAASDITNDALRLQAFILENIAEGDSSLSLYSKGELLIVQQKLSEALTLYESLPKLFPTSTLDDEALMTVGALETAMRRYPDAIRSYSRIEGEYPESVLLDAATMNIGSLYETGLYDKPKAINTYEKILEHYPNSIFVNEARKRIRALRGDTL